MIATDLPTLARDAGLRPSRGGGWKRPGSNERWQIRHMRTLLRMETPWPLAPDAVALAEHAELAGPVKLAGNGNEAVARVELFVGPGHGDAERLVDPEAAARAQQRVGGLIELGSTLGARDEIDGWEPPEPARLAGWLAQLGYEPATDQEQNLRLTLKCPGRDGQVRIERRAGRLRLTMRLGDWPALDAAPRAAMLALASQFNARTALVRIAWRGAASGRQRAEAQVDLSGIPAAPKDDPVLQGLWLQSLRGATAGLQLALAQLALELEVLADERNCDLVEALL